MCRVPCLAIETGSLCPPPPPPHSFAKEYYIFTQPEPTHLLMVCGLPLSFKPPFLSQVYRGSHLSFFPGSLWPYAY